MIKRLVAIIMSAVLFIGVMGTFSACDSAETVSNSSETESTDVSSVTESGTDNTESQESESQVQESYNLYGVWVTDWDLTDSIEKFMAQVYPESVVVVDTVVVDYVATFNKDGTYSFSMNAANIFYNELLKTVEKHLRSLTSSATTINLKISEFKKLYKQESFVKSLNRKQEGKFSVQGNVNSSGTATLINDMNESQMKFSIEDNQLTITPLVDGQPSKEDEMVFTRQVD